jgi:hypothetical protein
LKDLLFLDLSQPSETVNPIIGDLRFRLLRARTENRNLILELEWRWEGSGKSDIWFDWLAHASSLKCKGVSYQQKSYQQAAFQPPTPDFSAGSIEYELFGHPSDCSFDVKSDKDEYSIPLQTLIARQLAAIPSATAPSAPIATPTIRQDLATMLPTVKSGAAGAPMRCGDLFEATILSPISFMQSIRNNLAGGVYLVVEIQLLNLKGVIYRNLYEEDYEIVGVVDGKQVVFPASFSPSFDLYFDRSMTDPNFAFFVDDVVPNFPFHTMIAFDVDPQGSDWVLWIRPNSHTGQPDCSLAIPLP